MYICLITELCGVKNFEKPKMKFQFSWQKIQQMCEHIFIGFSLTKLQKVPFENGFEKLKKKHKY